MNRASSSIAPLEPVNASEDTEDHPQRRSAYRAPRQSVSQRLRSINLKVLLFSLGLSLVVVLATVMVSLRFALIESHQVRAAGLADYVAPALVFDDRKATQGYLDGLSDSRNILRAAVYLPGASASYAEYRNTELTPAQQASSPQFSLSAPIHYRDQRLGTIEMVISLSSVYREAVKITAIILLASVLVFVLVSLSLGRLNASIVNPLQRLDQLMQKVASSGDYSLRAPPSDVEEIHHLSSQFNELLARISSREVKIEQLANYDLLTGLYNRRGLTKQLKQNLRLARKTTRQPALIFLDLDNFKTINDTLGHDLGDTVLAQVGQRIARATQAGNTEVMAPQALGNVQMGRLGGDEFLLIVPHASIAEDVLELADRVRQAVCEPINARGNTVHVTTSIGIACYPADGETASELMQHADSAMYHAKEKGRDQCRFYDPELTRRASFRMRILDQMREALANNDFRLEYQPLITARDGSINAAEALLRWECPGEKVMHPGIFIPIAESSGLIVPLGKWVVQTACNDAVRMAAECGKPVRVAVNISPAQIFARGFTDTVRECLQTSGLRPDLLEIELTEDVVIERYQSAHDPLTELAAMGVLIALDDFGTGYSSMSYLKRLPIRRLKIDRSFVDGLPGDADDMAIVTAVIAMAKALGLRITAEGVETPEQQRLLKNMGCDMLQGFLFSASVTPDKLIALINDNSQQLTASQTS